MPQTTASLPVTGTIATDSDGTMLILSERLDGHDTFLTGQLEITGYAALGVRIMTFDDVTVLRIIDDSGPPPWAEWSGILHLPHGWRERSIPDDLLTAAQLASRNVNALDPAELRYALTFLGEATTDTIRRGRIESIVSALPVTARTAS